MRQIKLYNGAWFDLATAFFKEYVICEYGGRELKGKMHPADMRDAVEFLLHEGIFTSKEDMCKEAMRSYGITLPYEFFEPWTDQ